MPQKRGNLLVFIDNTFEFMNRKIFLFFFFFLIPFGAFAHTEDIIYITKQNTVLFSYSKNPSFEAALKKGDISLSFQGTGATFSQNFPKKSFILQIVDADIVTGKISITGRKVSKDISLSFSENLRKKDFSLFSKFSFLRLQSKPLTCESSATADVLSYLL